MSGLSRLASAYVGGIALVGGALFVFAATHPMKWVVIVPVVVLIIAADVAPAILRTNQGRGAEVVMSAGFPHPCCRSPSRRSSTTS